MAPVRIDHRSRSLPLCSGLAVLLALAPGRAAAQAPGDPVAAVPGDGCHDGRITSIFVDNHSVFDLSDKDLSSRTAWAYQMANRLHRPTRESVIRRELLFREGDCYEREALRESERVLRAAPFIADVDIYGIRQPDGSYHVVVDTRDDWSTRVEVQMESGTTTDVEGLGLREDNLLGTGHSVALFALRRYGERTYGASYATPQLFGTRWDARLAVGRTPTGTLVAQALAYPFVGEAGRWAFLERTEHHDRFFEFYLPSDSGRLVVLLPEQRRTAEVGFVWRSGRRGSLTLLGAGVAGERISYPRAPRYARRDDWPTGYAPPLDTAAFALDSISSVRALVRAGQRNVHFVRRRGLETVRGTEDVRLGVEMEGALGHTLGRLSSDDGLSLDFGLFTAGEIVPGMLAGSQLSVEARRNLDAPPERSEWSDVFAQLDGWAYWRPSEGSRHTVVALLSGVGGWHTAVPFQLTVGGAAGLRGYPRHEYPGGRRVVLSLEHRAYLGWPLPRLFDLGLVGTLDFGRIWAGDAPFGRTSPYLASAGLGLRTAFPPGSKQTLRLDVAAPVGGGFSTGEVTFLLSFGQALGVGSVRPEPQLLRSSRRALSTSLFNFPN